MTNTTPRGRMSGSVFVVCFVAFVVGVGIAFLSSPIGGTVIVLGAAAVMVLSLREGVR